MKAVSLATAKLYQEDIAFIIEHGQHPRTIIREALHAYCEAWRKELEWVPALKVVPKIRPVPRIPSRTITRIPSPAPDIMRTWTKKQRDAWILNGTTPAMMDDNPEPGEDKNSLKKAKGLLVKTA